MFIIDYLKQISTWSGLLKLLSALGLFTLAPETADVVAAAAVDVVTGVLAILGGFDIIRNEKTE